MTREAAGEIVVERDLMVPARDGSGWRPTFIARPAAGPFPVLLERTPYDKSAPSRSERTAAAAAPRSRAEVAGYFVRHGYAVVYQDCRGRYKSDGRFTKYLSEAEDGYDTLAWLLRQPWCNGRIGTFGLSYAAHAQAALGCLDPPGLAAQFLDCGGFSNAYRSGIRHDGAFDLKQATWAYNNALADAKDPAVKAALKAQDIKAWFARMPWRKGHSPLSAAPEYEDYLFEQWSHGAFDDFWKQPGIYAEGYWDRYADVPVVHLSGWYDPYARTAAENYVGLSRRGRAPKRLILGPWTHGDRSLSYAGDVDFGAGRGGRRQPRRGFLCAAPALVRPLAEGRRERRRDRTAGAGLRHGRRIGAAQRRGPARSRRPLARAPPTGRCRRPNRPPSTCMPTAPSARQNRRDGAPPLAYRFDPRHPVPTIGGALSSGEPVMRGGAYDQREGPRFFGAREPYRRFATGPTCCPSPPRRSTASSKSPARSRSGCGSPPTVRTPTSPQS